MTFKLFYSTNDNPIINGVNVTITREIQSRIEHIQRIVDAEEDFVSIAIENPFNEAVVIGHHGHKIGEMKDLFSNITLNIYPRYICLVGQHNYEIYEFKII